jgi:hypothetical protein
MVPFAIFDMQYLSVQYKISKNKDVQFFAAILCFEKHIIPVIVQSVKPGVRVRAAAPRDG